MVLVSIVIDAVMPVIPAVSFSGFVRIYAVGFCFSGTVSMSTDLETAFVPSDTSSSAVRYLPAVSLPSPKVTFWLLEELEIAL